MEENEDEFLLDEDFSDFDYGYSVSEPCASYDVTIESRSVKDPLVEKAPPLIDDIAVNKWLSRPFRYSKRGKNWEYYQQIGREGEQRVLEFEKARLRKANRPDLAEKVRTTEEEVADIFDIHSFDADGEPIFIEVKTTDESSLHPFIVSERQIAASELHGEKYRLYRVYKVRSAAEFFVLRGPLSMSSRTAVKALWCWPESH